MANLFYFDQGVAFPRQQIIKPQKWGKTFFALDSSTLFQDTAEKPG